MGLPLTQASVGIPNCNIKIHRRHPSGPSEMLEVITKTKADEREWSYDLLFAGKSCVMLNMPLQSCSIDEKGSKPLPET